jgi:outer membrane autotransporter protein
MSQFASGSSLRTQALRPISHPIRSRLAWLFALVAVLTCNGAIAGSIAFNAPFPGDLSQIAAAGGTVPNPLRLQTTSIDSPLMWMIDPSETTGGAFMTAAGNLDTTVNDGSKIVLFGTVNVPTGPNLTLGPAVGNVTITTCAAQENSPGVYGCINSGPVFAASTASVDKASSDGFRVERNETLTVEAQALDGGTPPNAPVNIDFSISGPATALTPTTAASDSLTPALFQIQVDASAPDNAVITVTATRQDVPAAFATFTFTLNEFLLLQTSPADGTPVQAGSNVILTVDALFNGGAPDNEQASQTIEWEIVSGPPGTTLNGFAPSTTSQTGGNFGTTATVDLFVGAPTFPGDPPLIVRATAIDTMFSPRPGATIKGTTSPNARTVDFNVAAFDQLTLTTIAGDGQSADVGTPVPVSYEVEVFRNGAADNGRQVNWSVSPPNAVTFSGGAPTAQSIIAGGIASVAVSSVNTTGPITITATHNDRPTLSDSFGLTGTGTIDNSIRTIEQPEDSGDGTSAAPGSEVELLALTLIDNDPESDVLVEWVVQAGAGRLRTFTTRSDASGIARNTVTLPTVPGTTRIRAARADTPATGVVYFVTAVDDSLALSIVSGNGQDGGAGDSGDPMVVRLTRNGAPVTDTNINWSVLSGSASLSSPVSSTDSDGQSQIGFTFGTSPGPISIRASSGGAQVVFNHELIDATVGPQLRLVSGAGQSGPIGTRADFPIIVEVIDADGMPVAGRRVDWTLLSGSASFDQPSLDTDANGRASQGLTFGPDAGPILIRASIFDAAGGRVDIPATSFVPTLSLVSGNNQSAPVSTTLPQDVVVAIAAPASRAKSLAGVTVRWTVVLGGGSLLGGTSLTDANGRASNRLTLGPNVGLNRVTASIDGGNGVSFDATGTSAGLPLAIVSGNGQNIPTASDSAPLVVELKTANGQPISGATIDWSATNATFVDDVESTVTDAQGRSSNKVRVAMPGSASITARVRDSEGNQVTFTIDGRVANLSALNQPQQTVANAIDNLCPALDAASGLTPEAQDLLLRCRELVDNAGDNPDQVRRALEQLDQDIALALANTALGGLAAQFNNLRQRIGQLRTGQGGLSVSGLAIATPTGIMPLSFLPSILQGAEEDSTEVGSDFSRWGFFASGIIGRAKQDARSATPEYDYDTAGVTAGVDYRVNEAWVVGAALGYTKQDTELAQSRGDVDAKGWSVSGYTTWYNEKSWYLDGVLSLGSNDYDVRRQIAYEIVGANGSLTRISQQARASTSGDQLLFAVSGGRDFQKGAWNFGPYVRATYNRVEFDSYEERLQTGPGSGLGLAVSSRELKSMTGALGGKVSYAMSRDWGVLLPYAQLEWEHEFKDDPQQVVTRFLHDPTGTTIRLNGDSIDTDYYNIGFGLSAIFAGGRSAFLYYEHLAGSEGLTQDTLSLGVRIEF